MQLHLLLEEELDILILDIRPIEDFDVAHLIVQKDRLINVPEGIILPGYLLLILIASFVINFIDFRLSANTLGQLLPDEVHPMWERRDQYLVIVLIDLDTDRTNYKGSKLERLRELFVDVSIQSSC